MDLKNILETTGESIILAYLVGTEGYIAGFGLEQLAEYAGIINNFQGLKEWCAISGATFGVGIPLAERILENY